MADMDLNELLMRTPIKASGDMEIEIPAGMLIKTETSPAGADLVIGTVPADKIWRIKLIVHIEERDA